MAKRKSIMKFSDGEKHQHQPKTFAENNDVTVLWDVPIRTLTERWKRSLTLSSRTGRKRICILTDMSVPFERSTSVEVAEELSKYKDVDNNRMSGYED